MFSVQKKTIEAHYPRFRGSTILPEDRLKVVYNKYTTTNPSPDKIRINLIFAHGTGMNKLIWEYHITRLFEISNNGRANWYLGSAITFDAACHGDSALLNVGKVGWTYGWPDGGKDMIKIVNHEIDTTGDFINGATSKNIAIGHSLGGYATISAGYLEPDMFDTIMPVEAVFYTEAGAEKIFIPRFLKISKMIIDSFDSFEEFYQYYGKMSFYATMDKKVKDKYIADECYQVYDAATKETKYKLKTNKNNQLATYFSAYFYLQQGMDMVPHIRSHIVFVTGSEATWNAPNAPNYFKTHVNDGNKLDMKVIKGSHLAHGDSPEEMIDVIVEACDKRGEAGIKEKNNWPEYKYGGDRKKIMEDRMGMLMGGKISELVDYSKSKL